MATTEFAMGKMRRSMEVGRFSMEYYLRMWTKRLNKYDSEKVRGVDSTWHSPKVSEDSGPARNELLVLAARHRRCNNRQQSRFLC
jgi:hypothetical protein